MTPPLIQVADLGVVFPGPPTRRRTSSSGDVVAVQGLDLTVHPGEFLSLIGPSGCGKSTVLRVLGGLQQPSTGSIVVTDHPTAGTGAGRGTGANRAAGSRTAMMPQTDCLLPWRRALPNALIGARIAGTVTPAVRARAAELFVTFGLGGFERSWPRELSGGMRQRLALLRTVLTGRPILLLDEPFAALDPILRRQLNLWLAGVWSTDLGAAGDGTMQPRTTVLVTHDVEEAMLLSDRILVMSGRPGTVVAEFRPVRPTVTADDHLEWRRWAADPVMRAEILAALG